MLHHHVPNAKYSAQADMSQRDADLQMTQAFDESSHFCFVMKFHHARWKVYDKISIFK